MKEPMTTNEERNNETLHAIHLCIELLTSSKMFKNFANTNNLRKQLVEIAMDTNEKENYIGKMFIATFNEFNSQLQSNLKHEMYSIFGIKKIKTITVSQKSRKLFKRRTQDDIKTMLQRSSLMKLNIRNEDNKPLKTIENVFNNALETKIQKYTDHKQISTTRTIEKIPNVLIIQYKRFNNTTKKLQEDVKCKLTVNLSNTPYKLRGVIVHEGDNFDNGNYIGILRNIPIGKNITICLILKTKKMVTSYT